MDETIFLALLQDGLTTGAIYVLLAIGLLIAFTVTRVIFIPQGDLVSYAALTLASIIGHHLPGTIWLLDILCAAALALSLAQGRLTAIIPYALGAATLTLAVWAATQYGAPAPVSMLLALTIVTALGPLLYRFAYEPLGESSMLALLIVSMALHFVLIGIALLVARHPRRRPGMERVLDRLEYIALAAVIPVTLWVGGVYSLVGDARLP